jgi:cytochrome c oxidase subunit 4
MEKMVEPKIYLRTGAALLVLLALTWAIGYLNLGPFNLIIALTIAMTKALLIGLFFMHIKASSRVLRLAACTGVIWLIIMMALALSDYVTR